MVYKFANYLDWNDCQTYSALFYQVIYFFYLWKSSWNPSLGVVTVVVEWGLFKTECHTY